MSFNLYVYLFKYIFFISLSTNWNFFLLFIQHFILTNYIKKYLNYIRKQKCNTLFFKCGKKTDYFKIKYATYKLVKFSFQRGNQINGKMMPAIQKKTSI